MDLLRTLRLSIARTMGWTICLIMAPACLGQGLSASLSDAGMQIDSSSLPPHTPGVQATLSDLAGFESKASPIWAADSESEPTDQAARSNPLQRFAANVEVPFADVAESRWQLRRSTNRSANQSARIQVFPTEDGSASPVHPASLQSAGMRGAPLLVDPQDREYLQSDARPTATAADLTRNPQSNSVPGPLPQQRAMFSFATTRPNPIQAVAAHDPPPAGLPAMLKITVDGPRNVAVGETATFSVTTENVGHEAAHDVCLVVESGRESRIVACDPAPLQQGSGEVQIALGKVEGGALRSITVEVQAQHEGAIRLRCRTRFGGAPRTAESPTTPAPR